ncbi:uncharacterized protein LOC132552233 [Ylistrum balloti]|uniref:uncharacterized protein LOC132552233 n=1 Tax=Ylistrum balloti TaxID=509963 RepID=UPI002905DBF7|nr:uncharacterized protein LOC132552233 [Ylistrum balloti]
MSSLQSTTVVHLFLCILFICILGGESSTKCYRDELVGDREGNVYHCEDPDKPECCEEDQEFTCCQTQSSKTLKEQFILWGGVLTAVILITVMLCWLCKDWNCCASDKSVRDRCCCTKSDESDNDLLDDDDYRRKCRPYQISPFTRTLPPDEDLKIQPGSSSGSMTQFY